MANELFNIFELVSDTAGIFRVTIEQKHLQFNVWQDPTIPQLVMGDSGKVRQIVSSLSFLLLFISLLMVVLIGFDWQSYRIC